MKYLYSLFILFPLFSFAQLHVTVGAQKGMEWENHYSNEEGVFTAQNFLTPTLKSEFWTDHYSAGVRFLDRKIWYAASLTYLYSSYHISTRHYDYENSKYYTIWSDYNLDLKYAYLGLDLRVEGVLNDVDSKFQYILGNRLAIDFNVLTSKKNQTRTSYTSFVGVDEDVVYGPFEDGENMAEMIVPAKVFVAFGPTFTFRLNLKSIVIDLPFGIGFRMMDRASFNVDSTDFTDAEIGFYFNYGIRLGYKINKKE
jgi:hypothetical protein